MTPQLAELTAIDLDTLVATASRQTRVDRKYLVPRETVATLLRAVADDALVLEIDGLRDFVYRSVYFDTPDLACFRAAGQRRRRRFKVRTREYLDTGTTWLEVKTRGPRGTSVKGRIAHPGPNPAALGADGLAFVTHRLESEHLDASDVAALRPTLATAYRRITMALGSDRVTIDTGLSWTALGPSADAGTELARPSLAVVETKAGSAPTQVDRLLWRLGHRPVRMSKYGAGLAALDPDLPDLKWHRVIATHLTAPTIDDKDLS